MDLLRSLPAQYINRRDFLKWSSLAFLGLYLPGDYPKLEGDTIFHGRVLENVVTVYDQPSFSGKFVKVYWRDIVLPISAVSVGSEPRHNRVWYQVRDEGYIHSGSLQPVEIRPNSPQANIPSGGLLAEVTVPYAEARWKPALEARLAYRIYYGTTHWILSAEEDESGIAWYRIYDDKWKLNYYVDARHLRIIPVEELKPSQSGLPLEGKRLHIHLGHQVLTAFEEDVPVYMTRIASGARFSNGDFTTPSGTFMTYHKRPYRHMAAGDFAAANSYDLPGVPWVCYFTPEGISIHGTFWHNDFGKTRSHGCINLSVQAARWVYLWTQPFVPALEQYAYKNYGTTVDIE